MTCLIYIISTLQIILLLGIHDEGRVCYFTWYLWYKYVETGGGAEGEYNYYSNRIFSLVKKSHEATFMSISGFFYKYLCIMSYNKWEHSRIGLLVKYIDLWYAEQIQSKRLDVNTSKGILEKVSNTLDVLLIHIDTYHSDGKIAFLLGHK